MRKANYPQLNLPPCQVSPLLLSSLLGTDYIENGCKIAIERNLRGTHPPKSNTPADYRLKLTMLEGSPLVYDDLRKLWLPLTPEEWVRQHFVAHLIRDLGYPAELMMNEVSLKIGAVDKRIDSVLYSRRPSLGPLPCMAMIMEYKAPQVGLTPHVLEQALRYNYATHAAYIAISNGLEHQLYRIDYVGQTYEILEHIPPYTELKGI